MRGFRMAVLLATVVALGGCRSSALQKDQDRFRQTILDSYTNQIMDNLIRASNAMPIVQVDFTNITGTVTDVGSVGTSPSRPPPTTPSSPSPHSRSSPSVPRSECSPTPPPGTSTPAAQQQLSVTGVPVIDKPEIYRAYLDFLSKPGSLDPRLQPAAAGAGTSRPQGRGDLFLCADRLQKRILRARSEDHRDARRAGRAQRDLQEQGGDGRRQSARSGRHRPAATPFTS